MAVRDEPLAGLAGTDRRLLAGFGALAAIGVLLGGALLGLALAGGGDLAAALAAFDPYLARVARFTLWQAALSTILSVLPGMMVARALSRHPAFLGRTLLLRLFAVPFALPAIVAALGILTLYGRAGLFSGVPLSLSGGTWTGIYGLSGILLAHVFFNLPLSARMFLASLDTVPADQWRLASQLGMGQWALFRLVEWPVMRAALPAVAGLVFMLAITSFTIVLTLGGGPQASTLEVAIYQALRFDFDPARAVALTALQVLLTGAALAVLRRLGANLAGDAGLSVGRRIRRDTTPAASAIDAAMIGLAAAFVVGPMLATLIAGLRSDLARLLGEPIFWRATVTSVVLAALAAGLATLLSLCLAAARRALAKGRGPRAGGLFAELADTGAGLVLVVPPVVIGAGWFILLSQTGADVFVWAPAMVVAVNAVMAMPFSLNAIRPAYDAAGDRYDRLAAQLGMVGLDRLRLVDWPLLRPVLATGFAFAMALSLGDLGVIALFGSESVQTLPYLLLGRLGSYRTADAAGLAMLLGLLCLALMAFSDRLGSVRGERTLG